MAKMAGPRPRPRNKTLLLVKFVLMFGLAVVEVRESAATDKTFFTRHTPVSLHHGIHGNGVHPQCEPLRIDMCRGVGYEETLMPNILNHDTQGDAGAFLESFTPLIKYGCSPHLTLLLCSTYAPMCTNKVAQPIGPCQDVCLSVRSKCEPVLKEFGFPWPESLNCSLFHPENNHEHMCIPVPNMDPAETHLPPLPQPPPIQHVIPVGPIMHHDLSPNFPFPGLLNPVDQSPVAPAPPSSSPGRGKNVQVPTKNVDFPLGPSSKIVIPIIPSGTSIQSPQTPGGNSLNCGDGKISSRGECWTPCDGSGGFTSDEQKSARDYVLWPSLTALLLSISLIFIATSCARKLCSPAEKPLLYIICCQIAYSAGLLGGVLNTWDGCVLDKQSSVHVLARSGLVPPSCSLVFYLTYFFGNVINAWWLCLCMSWALSLRKSFATRLASREPSFFHLMAWGSGSLQTCLVLLGKHIDSDALTGVCGVGYQDSKDLLYLRLIPSSLCVSLGLVFILWGGIVRLFRGRKAGKGVDYQCVSSSIPTFANSQQARLKEENKAMWTRLLTFSVLHLVSLVVGLVLTFYEYLYREDELEGIRRSNADLSGRQRRIERILILHNLPLAPALTAYVWLFWRTSWKNWLGVFTELGKKFRCNKKLSESSGNLRRRQQGYNNPSTRSLPPPPEEALVHPQHHHHHHYEHHPPHHHYGHGHGHHEMRTDTWRRGETIV